LYTPPPIKDLLQVLVLFSPPTIAEPEASKHVTLATPPPIVEYIAFEVFVKPPPIAEKHPDETFPQPPPIAE
jgi:hypothetical protein